MTFVQVAEEVGELQVHCCYGCKLKDANTGECEVDEEGELCVCVCVCVCVHTRVCLFVCFAMYIFVCFVLL